MKPNHALGLAIVCAVAAVSLVSADLAYNLVATLDAKEGENSWQTYSSLSSGGYPEYRGKFYPGYSGDCGGQAWRVVLDNHKPLEEDVQLRIQVFNGTNNVYDTLRTEDVPLRAFEIRTFEFTVPTTAFGNPPGSPPGTLRPANQTDISVSVNEQALTACAKKEANP